MYITQHRYSIERLPEATIGGGWIGPFQFIAQLAFLNMLSPFVHIFFFISTKIYWYVCSSSKNLREKGRVDNFHRGGNLMLHATGNEVHKPVP